MNPEQQRSLKLVHIASGDLWAGAEIQLFTLAKQLEKSGSVSLSVILMNHGRLEKELLDNKIDTYVFDEQKYSSLYILYRVYKLLLIIKPDIIHTHRLKENITGSIAGLLAGTNILIRTVHGAPEHKPPLYKIWKHIYIYLDGICGKYIQKRIIAVSQELSEVLSRDFDKEKISVIENGIDLQAVKSQALCRTTLPGSPDSIKIGIICRLVPVKRVDLFIDIAKNITDMHPGTVEFYVFGDGPLSFEIKNKIDKLNISHNVYMLGFIDNIHGYMKDLDLLLITSDHEGLPMNLLEAMSLKIPVISSSVGGIPHVLGHGKYGTLIHQQTTEKYTDAIIEYINNPDAFTRKSVNGYQHLKACYSAEINADKYIQIYNSLFHN